MSDIEPSGPGWDYPAEDDRNCDEPEYEPDYEQMAADRDEAAAERQIDRLRHKDLWND